MSNNEIPDTRPVPVHRIDFSGFTNENLAWDFHCNLGAGTKQQIQTEAERRSVNLCAIQQIRKSGPFPGWRTWRRPPCGGCI